MQTLRQFLEQLLDRQDLAEAQAQALLGMLTDPGLEPALAGAVLAALRVKGVTAAEVRGFATAMRALSRKPALPHAPDAIDIVGTGGDASGSLNLSTGAALLTAACGMPVVKHGNRSISSRSGSADLIEQLGLKLPLDELRAAQCFAATDFTFLFAPYYHPAMRVLAPIRSALGVRTIFNLLGPLTNPAAPRFRLIGAYDAQAAELMAETLAGMELEGHGSFMVPADGTRSRRSARSSRSTSHPAACGAWLSIRNPWAWRHAERRRSQAVTPPSTRRRFVRYSKGAIAVPTSRRSHCRADLRFISRGVRPVSRPG